jgi:hypothetical protein
MSTVHSAREMLRSSCPPLQLEHLTMQPASCQRVQVGLCAQRAELRFLSESILAKNW